MGIKIHSRAPTRIDLAGGTLDIWPLYLFLQNPVTLNLGIDLFAEATAVVTPATGRPGEVVLRSEDQKNELRFAWKDLGSHSTVPGNLELHYKLLHYFARRSGTPSDLEASDFTLSTRAKSPAGAGLGGSSTLSIALVGALQTWASGLQPLDPLKEGERFIEIVRDVETTVIRVPAGLQDYYGAMYGGLQSLRWRPGSHEREYLPTHLLRGLEDRVLLFYSGQSRNSGINNWALFKNLIDQDPETLDKFRKINHATLRVEAALRAEDWTGVGAAIAQEWETRRTLARGITTPEIDSAFEESHRLGKIAGKVCGAGGGGCFFVYLSEGDARKRAELKEKIAEVFASRGMRPLPFHAVPQGLEVEVTRDI